MLSALKRGTMGLFLILFIRMSDCKHVRFLSAKISDQLRYAKGVTAIN